MNTFPYVLASKVKGRVDEIYGTNQATWYMSDPVTKYKCIETDDGTWINEKNHKTIHNLKRRFILNCRAIDHTGSQIVIMFDDQAVQLLGHTADELFTMHMLGQHTRIELIYKEATYMEYYLSLRVKMVTYNNETRQKIVVTAMTPLNQEPECAKHTTTIDTSE